MQHEAAHAQRENLVPVNPERQDVPGVRGLLSRFRFSLLVGRGGILPFAVTALFVLAGRSVAPHIDPEISLLKDSQAKIAEQVAAIATQIQNTFSGASSTGTGNTGGFNITGSPASTAILALGYPLMWLVPTPWSLWKKMVCKSKEGVGKAVRREE